MFLTDVGFDSVAGILKIALLIVLSPLLIVFDFFAAILFVIVYTMFLVYAFVNGGFTCLEETRTTQFYLTIGAPMLAALTLFKDIQKFVDFKLHPYTQGIPTAIATAAAAAPTKSSQDSESVPDRIIAQQTSDVMYHLSIVLESPIATTLTMFQNENMFTNMMMSNGDDDAMDCELTMLKCKSETVLDVLPF